VILAHLLLLAVAAATPSDSLPLRHKAENGTLRVEMRSLSALAVREPFHYVGGQRFILKGVADAEQHFFVVADKEKRIARMYWIQVEEMLPGKDGTYDYSKDQGIAVDGFSVSASARTYENPPVAGSDRDAAHAFLKARGYALSDVGTRLRLVYLPESPARREVMIIYLETDSAAASATQESLVTRATERLTLIGRATR
jgi:hypothetical protein